MFNEARKSEFIRDYTKSASTARACTVLFNFVEGFEKKYDRDFSVFTDDQVVDLTNNLGGVRNASVFNRLIILRAYVKWCKRNHVANVNEFILSYLPDSANKIRKAMVCSPAHLAQYLDIVYAPESEMTVDVTSRAFLWLLYSGVNEDDIMNLTADELDFDNMVIKIGDKEYIIYRESVQCLRACATAQGFEYHHPNYDNKYIYRERIPGKQLLRGIKAEMTISGMKNLLAIKTRSAVSEGKTNARITCGRVYLSGLFYRMSERERIGIPVDFSDVADDFMDGKEYSLSRRKTMESKRKEIAAFFKEDYDQWKLAFSI